MPIMMLVALICFCLFGTCGYLYHPYIAIVWLVLNMLTGLIFFIDKRAAKMHKQQKRRVRERTLLLFSVLACWPAAYWAMQSLRHKTQKRAFLIPFWFLAAFQTLAVLYLLYVYLQAATFAVT
ncbi:DUF1294 domain-containing protein [Shewanella maritima]|uniref:DUF1294 domain-containing protein n=1 Tax=Shewanella maritima TaxID=2520507 RepID=UPI0037354692